MTALRRWRVAGAPGTLAAIVFALAWTMACAQGQALRDGASYVGTWSDGATVWAEVLVGENAEASVRIRSEPMPRGDSPGPHFDLSADPVWGDVRLRFTGRTRAWHDAVGGGGPRPPAPPAGPVAVQLEADLRDDRTLDPFGSAILTLDPAPHGTEPATLRLHGVGTTFHSRAGLLDGTVGVLRTAPFFYATPWRSLDLSSRMRESALASATEGLAVRRQLPRSVSGFWIDEASARVMALGEQLVSVRYEAYAYTGGAHPNTFTWTETFLRTDAEWRVAGLCDVLAALDLACSEGELREQVIAALVEQKAYWVVEGDVARDTPWLLDRFTVTAAGLRFDFDPYDVGPYAQGPFVVRIPFRDLADP